MSAVIWKRTETDSWTGDEEGHRIGVIDEIRPHQFHLRNSVGTELGDFETLRDAQRRITADRMAPPADHVSVAVGPGRHDAVIDIDSLAADMQRVRLNQQTVGFVRRVGHLFVALAGPTLHLAVEVAQCYSMSDAVDRIHSAVSMAATGQGAAR